MADSYSPGGSGAGPGGGTIEPGRGGSPIIIQNHMPKQPWIGRSFLKFALAASLVANFVLMGMSQRYYGSAPGEKFLSGDKAAKEKIAVVKVEGMITADSIVDPKKELKTALEDAEVKAVVLAVTSPGGTISASDELYHAIEEFKTKSGKPVVVSMVGMGTSGAYYISMPADKVFADRSCITGSIGVIANLMDLSKLAEDWGIKPETIKSGKMKDSGSMLRPLTEEEKAEWQRMINSMFDQFLEVIVLHRGEKIGGIEKLRELADGRVYVAQEALEHKLIDAIGYQDDAIAEAGKIAGISSKPRVVTYVRTSDSLLELLTSGQASQAAKCMNWDARAILRTLSPQILLLPGTMPALAL